MAYHSYVVGVLLQYIGGQLSQLTTFSIFIEKGPMCLLFRSLDLISGHLWEFIKPPVRRLGGGVHHVS